MDTHGMLNIHHAGENWVCRTHTDKFIYFDLNWQIESSQAIIGAKLRERESRTANKMNYAPPMDGVSGFHALQWNFHPRRAARLTNKHPSLPLGEGVAAIRTGLIDCINQPRKQWSLDAKFAATHCAPRWIIISPAHIRRSLRHINSITRSVAPQLITLRRLTL